MHPRRSHSGSYWAGVRAPGDAERAPISRPWPPPARTACPSAPPSAPAPPCTPAGLTQAPTGPACVRPATLSVRLFRALGHRQLAPLAHQDLHQHLRRHAPPPVSLGLLLGRRMRPATFAGRAPISRPRPPPARTACPSAPPSAPAPPCTPAGLTQAPTGPACVRPATLSVRLFRALGHRQLAPLAHQHLHQHLRRHAPPPVSLRLLLGRRACARRR